jgi:hypothetical protein
VCAFSENAEWSVLICRNTRMNLNVLAECELWKCALSPHRWSEVILQIENGFLPHGINLDTVTKDAEWNGVCSHKRNLCLLAAYMKLLHNQISQRIRNQVKHYFRLTTRSSEGFFWPNQFKSIFHASVPLLSFFVASYSRIFPRQLLPS